MATRAPARETSGPTPAVIPGPFVFSLVPRAGELRAELRQRVRSRIGADATAEEVAAVTSSVVEWLDSQIHWAAAVEREYGRPLTPEDGEVITSQISLMVREAANGRGDRG